jgi:hypothetical protein
MMDRLAFWTATRIVWHKTGPLQLTAFPRHRFGIR